MDVDSSNRIKPIQKIFFGGPGSGTSYQAKALAQKIISSNGREQASVNTSTPKALWMTFHPSYRHIDFLGDCLPFNASSGQTYYRPFPGHFLQILGQAYRKLCSDNVEPAVLIIDELSHGDATAIFGSCLLLLNRDDDGWSSYPLDLNERFLGCLLHAMGYAVILTSKGLLVEEMKIELFWQKVRQELAQKENINGLHLVDYLSVGKIVLPPNLCLLATANTGQLAENLDATFVRCWDWEYLSPPGFNTSEPPQELQDVKIIAFFETIQWSKFVVHLNEFISFHRRQLDQTEDKSIGWWFIAPVQGEISEYIIQRKLMLHLWNHVFSQDRDPLSKLLSQYTNQEIRLSSYQSFISFYNEFVLAIVFEAWNPT